MAYLKFTLTRLSAMAFIRNMPYVVYKSTCNQLVQPFFKYMLQVIVPRASIFFILFPVFS